MRITIASLIIALASCAAALPSAEPINSMVDSLDNLDNLDIRDIDVRSIDTSPNPAMEGILEKRKTAPYAKAQGWASNKCSSKSLIKEWEEKPVGTLKNKKAICYYPRNKKKAHSFKVTGFGCSTVLYQGFACSGVNLFISNSKCTNFTYGSVLFICPIGDVLTL